MRLGIGHVFVESISNAGMHEGFGTVQPAGENRERCRADMKELEGLRQESVCSFVSIGVWKRKGGHTWERLAHGRTGGLCDDICSCLCLS